MVEVDVDFANAFPSLEHDRIDEEMQRLVPGVAPWCSWSHAEASTVWTPAGRSLLSDVARSRGTSQSRCSVALPSLACVSAVLWRALLAGIAADGTPPAAAGPEPFDVWFADDGKGDMRPAMLQE